MIALRRPQYDSLLSFGTIRSADGPPSSTYANSNKSYRGPGSLLDESLGSIGRFAPRRDAAALASLGADFMSPNRFVKSLEVLTRLEGCYCGLNLLSLDLPGLEAVQVDGDLLNALRFNDRVEVLPKDCAVAG